MPESAQPRLQQEEERLYASHPLYSAGNKPRVFEQRMTGRGSCRVPSADCEELGPALRQKLLGTERRAALQFLEDRALQCANRRVGVAMSAAERLGHDSVDDAERLQVGGGDLHRFGRLRRL